MGLLRAMHNSGALSRVTTVGGNSGGQWLLTQLLYSESFYKSIASDEDIVDVITAWGVKYHEGLKPLLPASSNTKVDFRKLEECARRDWHCERRKAAELREERRRLAREEALRRVKLAREQAEQRARDAADAAARAVERLAQEAADKIQDAKDAVEAAKASAEAAVEAAKAKAREALEWAKEKREMVRDAFEEFESFLSDMASGNATVCPSGGQMLAAGLDKLFGNMGLPVRAARHHAPPPPPTACPWPYNDTAPISALASCLPLRFILARTAPAQIFDWKLLTEVILSPSIGDDFGTKTYAELDRNGMPGNITFVQQVAMPPNAWTGAVGEGLVADLNVQFTDKEFESRWKSHGTMALPIAHYSTKSTSGWMMNEDIKSLSVTVHKESSFSTDTRKDDRKDDCDTDRNLYTSEIHLPIAPTVLEVTASSSGAGGFVASPALFRNQNFMRFETRVADWLTKCTATTLVDLSIPQRGMVDDEVSNAATPTYRFIDGGFVENTALASTIGRLHADNPNEDHLGSFIHFDLDTPFYGGEANELKCRVAALFSMDNTPEEGVCNTAKELCTDSDAFGQKNAQNIGRPVSTIFENMWPEAWPDNLGEWTEYAAHEECRITSTDGSTPPACTTISSYYWKGTMTTIENKWYGVPAGLKLELLVFAYNEPTSTILVGDNKAGDTGTGVGGRSMWEKVYGPIAKEQAEGAEKVIKDFLKI